MRARSDSGRAGLLALLREEPRPCTQAVGTSRSHIVITLWCCLETPESGAFWWSKNREAVAGTCGNFHGPKDVAIR